jgi:hypothetical protein
MRFEDVQMTKVSRKSHKNMGKEGKPKYNKRERYA